MQSEQNQCWHGVRAGSSSIPRQMGHRSDSVACSTSMTSSSCPAIAMDDAQDQQGKGYFSSTILPRQRSVGRALFGRFLRATRTPAKEIFSVVARCVLNCTKHDDDKHIDKSEDDQSADNCTILVKILPNKPLE